MTVRRSERVRSYAWFALQDLRVVPRHLLVNVIAASPLVPRAVRVLLYRLAGVRCGAANIYPGVRVLGSGTVVVESDAMINSGVTIDSRATVTIRAHAHVGPQVFIGTSTHEIGSADQRAGAPRAAAVEIERGAWVGACAVILPGVTIGEGAVVGAGAVVVGDCDPHWIYAGVPARPVRSLGTA